ncbi:MAG: hypothetical protein F4Y61_07630 [Rhodothermaceae bacterium]|nr:hypothetical protein [Rhodothermaceae bacterium]
MATATTDRTTNPSPSKPNRQRGAANGQSNQSKAFGTDTTSASIQSSKPLPKGIGHSYTELIQSPSPAPTDWAASCTHQECTLHQLSPYIGKLKSTIAHYLLSKYTSPGDLIADPFSGSGTIALQAALLGRRVFASDVSLYATTLTRAKLFSPTSESAALGRLESIFRHVARQPLPDLTEVPPWVRSFFHPRTLQETIRLAKYLKSRSLHFFLASLLGILHHQRPGFLSYPSSNLVPYLRSRKFPRSDFPELYEYRSVNDRLRAKVSRAMKRAPKEDLTKFVVTVRRSSVENLTLNNSIDCAITSPPYMNALDYIRDNRLRLWLIGGDISDSKERTCDSMKNFTSAIRATARQFEANLKLNGHCIFVIGEKTSRNGDRYPSEELASTFLEHAPSFQLQKIICDQIPDIRRARRNSAGTKKENTLVFRKVSS